MMCSELNIYLRSTHYIINADQTNILTFYVIGSFKHQVIIHPKNRPFNIMVYVQEWRSDQNLTSTPR